MPTLTSTWLSDRFKWSLQSVPPDEFLITIAFLGKMTKRSAIQKIQKRMAEGVIPWLTLEKKTWSVDFDKLQITFPDMPIKKHWRGKVNVVPEVEEINGHFKDSVNTTITISVMQDDMKSRRIFLSHRSKDKKLVRRFQRALEAIGYDVWLDEKNLKAGDHLERGILKGFKESCAAVFFITENFKDERYLKTEIDYAMAQTREKEEYFRIITLAFQSPTEKIEIPELLKGFVWKSPRTELDALTEIIKALPIAPKQFDFKN